MMAGKQDDHEDGEGHVQQEQDSSLPQYPVPIFRTGSPPGKYSVFGNYRFGGRQQIVSLEG